MSILIENNLKEQKIYLLNVPFSAGFNQRIMSSFPTGDYSPWDNDRKAWVLHADALEDAEEVLKVYFPKENLMYTEV